MTTKKDENLPPGAVPIESVFGFKDYDPVASIPDIEPFHPPVIAEEKKHSKSSEKKEG